MASRVVVFGLLLCVSLAFGYEPSPLQDFCVADPNSPVLVNGLVCKDPKQVQAEHFSFSGLHLAGDTANRFGFAATQVNVAQVPGLNTLGISMVRLDIAAGGVIPPHTHPRASEILTVLDGTLGVGFVTSNPGNRLISKTLNKGDVFVFPVGLVHFQHNLGSTPVVAISALSSQSPGLNVVGDAVFGSDGPISGDVLAKAFQVDKSVVDFLQKQLGKKK